MVKKHSRFWCCKWFANSRLVAYWLNLFLSWNFIYIYIKDNLCQNAINMVYNGETDHYTKCICKQQRPSLEPFIFVNLTSIRRHWLCKRATKVLFNYANVHAELGFCDPHKDRLNQTESVNFLVLICTDFQRIPTSKYFMVSFRAPNILLLQKGDSVFYIWHLMKRLAVAYRHDKPGSLL